jgi:hypothetical protein
VIADQSWRAIAAAGVTPEALLAGAVEVGGARVVVAGDTLNVTYTFSLDAA